jgi:hypothetical protein
MLSCCETCKLKIALFRRFCLPIQICLLGVRGPGFQGARLPPDFPQASRWPGSALLPGVRCSGFQEVFRGQGPDFQGPEVRRPGTRLPGFFLFPGTGARGPGSGGFPAFSGSGGQASRRLSGGQGPGPGFQDTGGQVPGCVSFSIIYILPTGKMQA